MIPINHFILIIMSLSQIYTGMQHGVLNEAYIGGLPLHFPTLPDKLKEAGYINHLVGKWHLGYSSEEYTPVARGFHTMKGKPS